MKATEFSPQSGISLVEILIVLVIAAILTTLAIGQFASSRKNFQRQNLSRELKVNLERARFDSVKRHAVTTGTMARVAITSAPSFSVSLDANMNGTLENSETRVIDFNNRVDASIVASSTDYPLTVWFDQRGQTTIKNNSGAAVSSSFTVCGSGCPATAPNASNADVIYISPTGTVSMGAPGTIQTTFGNPSVTNSGATANLDNRVSVNSSNYPY